MRRRPAAGGHLPRIARVHQGGVVHADVPGAEPAQDDPARGALGGDPREVWHSRELALAHQSHRARRLAQPRAAVPPLRAPAVAAALQHRGRDVVQDAAAHARRARRAPAPARVPRPQVSAAGQALGEGAQARARRPRRRRGRGRRRGEGWQEEGRPRVRGRARSRAEEGSVRQVRADAGLQLAVPVHHPGVRHLLHHRGAPQARPRRPRRGAAAGVAPRAARRRPGRPQRRGAPAGDPQARAEAPRRQEPAQV